jgi:transcriptional regulator with XRE-family HTH domain
MRKPRNKTKASTRPDWASMISRLRHGLGLSQTTFGHEVHSSAMGVSRWERGAQEPPSHSYIEFGNLAGDPDCWFFLGTRRPPQWRFDAGHTETAEPLPQPKLNNFEIVHTGTSANKPAKSRLVAIPLLKIVAATNGEKGDDMPILQEAPASFCSNLEKN